MFSILAGMIFSAGWWIFIDGYSSCGNECDMTNSTAGYAWLPLVGATLVFVMLNGMQWRDLNDDITDDTKAAIKARIFLIFTLLLAVACMAGSGFIMAEKFLKAQDDPTVTIYKWSGVSCFAGTFTILGAAFLMRFTTLPPANVM